MLDNTAGSQLDDTERDTIRKQITDGMKCSICGSSVMLMSMNDGDTIACTGKLFEHCSGWSIDYENMQIVKIMESKV